jgi:hypothetical protein
MLQAACVLPIECRTLLEVVERVVATGPLEELTGQRFNLKRWRFILRTGRTLRMNGHADFHHWLRSRIETFCPSGCEAMFNLLTDRLLAERGRQRLIVVGIERPLLSPAELLDDLCKGLVKRLMAIRGGGVRALSR